MNQSNNINQSPYRRSSEPTTRKSSILNGVPESTGIQRRTSETFTTSNSMNARNYATYKSHLHDCSILEDVETVNNSNNQNNQAVKWTVPGTQLPPRVSSLYHLQEKLNSSQNAYQTNTKQLTQKSNIPTIIPSTGIDGISVVGTQSPTTTSLERKQKQTARTLLERKPSIIKRPSLERRSVQIVRTSSERKRPKLVGRTQSKRTVVKRSTAISKRKDKRIILEMSTTSNQTYANDPTDMDADLPPLRNRKTPWLPGPQPSPKLIHASLIPLPQYVEGVSNNSNKRSYNVSSSRLSMAASRILRSCRPRYVSSIFMSSDLSPAKLQEKDFFTVPQGNRASQIFRRRLLEQSLYMSFGGELTASTKPQLKRRRKTRKGYNAKLKDREARREKRRKERQEKRLSNDHKIDDKDHQNVNPVVIPKILDSEELVKKVEEQLRKKEYLMSPPPPPRYINQHENQISELIPIQRSKSNASNVSSLFSTLPERRSIRSDDLNDKMLESSTSVEPFPTHLTSQRKDRLTYSTTVFVQPPTILMSPDEVIHDFEDSQMEKQVESTEKRSADNSNPGTPLSPLSPSIYKFGSGLLSLFNKGFHRDTNSSAS
ncbi:16638_t:CDS:1, partial [Racocetra fulgida]